MYIADGWEESHLLAQIELSYLFAHIELVHLLAHIGLTYILAHIGLSQVLSHSLIYHLSENRHFVLNRAGKYDKENKYEGYFYSFLLINI